MKSLQLSRLFFFPFQNNMEPGPSFQTYKPAHPNLHGVVAYYYVHKCNDLIYSDSFQYYPHFRNGVTTYVDCEVEFSQTESHIKPAKKSKPTTLFSKNYDCAIAVHINGPFKKLGIAFEPLGLNHFIQEPFGVVAPDRVNVFTHFGPTFQELAREVLNSSVNPTEQLDQFLLHKMTGFENQRIQIAVKELFNEGMNASVQDLACNLNINRKTMLRDFRKDLGCSAKTYQKLIRFRLALNNYRQSAQKSSFTELALSHSYYDQPAFIKNFVEITGFSPRKFFSNLEQYGDADIFWRST